MTPTAENPIPLHQLTGRPGGVEVFRITPQDAGQLPQEIAAVPHRHDHYSCFFVEEGRIDLLVDFQMVHLPAASLLVSPPGQIHQLAALHEFQGWLLAADAKLISAAARSCIEQARTDAALLTLGKAERAWFQHLFSALHAAAAVPRPPLFHAEVLQSLLNAAICRAAALLQAQESQQVPAHPQRSIILINQFRRLVQQHFLTCKKPADFANKLHLTVSYLNDTVKSVTGFSVSYFIQQEVLAEAQRLLFYTDLSIKEIAGRLGYDDPKYFIRFFGKGTGISPALFRKNTGSYKQQT